MIAVQPQSFGASSRISIWRVSPGSAPLTYTGPVTGLTFAMSMRVTSLAVELLVSWPPDASAVSSATVAPDSISRTGGISLSQTVWRCSALTLWNE